MRRGISLLCMLAASVLDAEVCGNQPHSSPSVVVTAAQAGHRLEFKVGGEFHEALKLKVELVSPDGHREELPASEIEIGGAGQYLGPDIPTGNEGHRIKVSIISRTTGRVLAATNAGVG